MGGYWLDDGSDTTASGPADPSQTASCKLELDETARCYRRFFVGKVSTAHLLPPTHLFSYHLSFTPVVLKKTLSLSPSLLSPSIVHSLGLHPARYCNLVTLSLRQGFQSRSASNQEPQRSKPPFFRLCNFCSLRSSLKGHQCNRLNGAHAHNFPSFFYFSFYDSCRIIFFLQFLLFYSLSLKRMVAFIVRSCVADCVTHPKKQKKQKTGRVRGPRLLFENTQQTECVPIDLKSVLKSVLAP